MALTRRRFLSHAGMTAAASASVVLPGRTAERAAVDGEPQRIIHLVADGMSWGTLSCADHFSRLMRGRPLAWTELSRREGAGIAFVDMRSLNSLVTDSAAASSSWGSGSRVKNGYLNMLPDGRELKPLCTVFGDAAWGRGLVTTTEITHATPAGFAANIEDRDAAPKIAVQYLERRIDVLLGGGRQYFEAKSRKDKRDLKAEYRAAGYAVAETRDALLKLPQTSRWLGVFASGHLPFTIDHIADRKLLATVPNLADMTRLALRRLDGLGRFILQVEGGRVDHAAHASDAATTLREMIAFDEALEVCLEYQQEAGETLVLVTTDHGNSNLGLNGMGSSYGGSSQCFRHLTGVRRSVGEIYNALVKAAGAHASVERTFADGMKRKVLLVDPEVLTDVVADGTGYAMPVEKARAFVRYLAGEAKPVYDQMDSTSAQFGQLMANYLGIGWTGSSHTSDYVPLVAYGPGAARFQGFLRNTDLFPRYLELAGLHFKNPELPLMAECAPSAGEAERWEFRSDCPAQDA